MKPVVFLHTIYLVLSIVLTWLWSINSYLANYNLQLTGALILVYFVFKIISRPTNQSKSNLPSTLILNTICLLLVFSSGGLNSPLFFLLPLLIFALALLLDPPQSAVASLLLASLLAWQNYTSLTTNQIINLLSLILMTPLAILFGRNYLEMLESKGTIKILERNLINTETDSLLWISTRAKPSLATILNTTNDLLIYFNSKSTDLIPTNLISKLQTLHQDLITLYSSADNLEKSIEETSNKIDL